MAEGAAMCRLAAAVEMLEPAPKKVGAAELNTTARRRSAAATLVSIVFARQTRVTAMVWLFKTIQGACVGGCCCDGAKRSAVVC